MSKEIKAGIRIDLTGNVLPQSKRYTDAIHRFSKTGQHDLNALRSSGGRVSSMFNGMGTRLAGLAAGVGVANIAKGVADSERRMTRLGIAANKSDAEIKALKQHIYEAAISPDIRVDPSDITDAIEQIMELTGDFEFAEKQIRNIGITLQATGADGRAVGAMFAEFQKGGVTSTQAVAESVDSINMQGKEGAFLLRNMAGLLPQLAAGYKAVGRSGQIAFREIGAAAQVIRGANGTDDQTTTSILALLRVFSDAKKIKDLNDAGIKVFDAAELKRGHQMLRPIDELMTDIVKKSKGRATVIQGWLGDQEAMRAFGNIIDEYNKTGNVTSFKKFLNMMGDGTTTLNDSKRAANDSAAALDNLYAVLRKFADDKLTAPLHAIADGIKATIDGYDAARMWTSDAIEKTVDFVTPANNDMHLPGPRKSMVGEVVDAAKNSDVSRYTNSGIKQGIDAVGSVFGPSEPMFPTIQPVHQQINQLGRQTTQTAHQQAKPADGKVTVEIVSPVPTKVKSLTANSGEINVKNTRAGAHFQ